MSGNKKKIPVVEGMWTSPSGSDRKAELIGNQCCECGEIFFPRKENGICTYCQSINLKEIKFGTKGKIYNYTILMQKPPEYYQGEVPYAFGFVELPEGVRIRSHFCGCNFDELKPGMEVELVIEKLGENDSGNDIMSYKYKPVMA